MGQQKSFWLGEWRVEPDLNRLSRNEEEVHLEPKAMAVLVYLAERDGAVVSADEIITAVWDDRPMGDNPVYKTVAKLRKALEDDADKPVYVATVPKKGYRLVASIRQSRRSPESRKGTPRQVLPIAFGVLLGVALAVGFLWRPVDELANIRPISNFARSHSQPSFGPDGESVAFTSGTDGVPHVWVLDADAAQPRQLTTGDSADLRPRWSPDGTTILFMRAGAVWSIAPTGGEATELLRDASNPNWSRDGARIVFERRYEVWTANAGGGDQQRVPGIPRHELALEARWPAFSPDGAKIVFFDTADTPQGDLSVIDLASGESERLTSAPALGGAPVWSPSGDEIVYSSQRGGVRTLWSVNPESRMSRALLTGSGDDDFPDFSPDGARLAYSNSRERYVLLRSEPRTGNESRLYESRLALLGPELSPDRQTIAFFGAATAGGFQLLTIPVAGGEIASITSDPETAHALPRWSPDGAHLYFYKTAEENSFSRISLSGGEAETVVDGWTWNRANGARIDPGGTRVIYSRLAGQAPIQTLIRDLDTGADQPFYATLEYPRWSRDGSEILGSMYTNQRFPGDIAICAVGAERCRTIAEDARIPVWSADESQVFFVRGFGTSQELFVANANGVGQESKVFDMSPLFHLGPFYSVTDDNAILWVRHEQERGVVWVLER